MRSRLLVVDDNKNCRNLLKDLLGSRYTLDEASDGLQALEKISHSHFDCVISDIQMPRMSGIELSRKVKEKFPQIKVILISGSGRHFREIALESGAAYFFGKPFRIQELLDALRN